MRRVRVFFAPDGPVGEVVFRAIRGTVRIVLFRWLRLRHRGSERLRYEGPFIIAPVHRSHLDGPLVGSLTHRRVQYLSKEELFPPGIRGWLMTAIGGFPVKRGSADLEAMRSAMTLLDDGHAMLVFPEGTRQDRTDVGDIFDGTAWLAARSGVPVVPVGVWGTLDAMPSGARFPKRNQCAIVVGEAMDPPTGPDGRRPRRADLGAWTERLSSTLASLQTEARELAG